MPKNRSAQLIPLGTQMLVLTYKYIIHASNCKMQLKLILNVLNFENNDTIIIGLVAESIRVNRPRKPNDSRFNN